MKYGLIYADPPWQYSNQASNGKTDDHYPTMPTRDILRLPVWDLADEHAILALWYTGNFNEEAQQVAKAWGFDVRTMKGFTWAKLNANAEQNVNAALEHGVFDFWDFLDLLNKQTRMNGGNYTRANSEDVLIAVKGNGLERLNAGIKQMVYAPSGKHSEKPAEVRHRLELLYGDTPRIELFARAEIPGWHTWGNEAPFNDIELLPGRFEAKPFAKISNIKALAGHYLPILSASQGGK